MPRHPGLMAAAADDEDGAADEEEDDDVLDGPRPPGPAVLGAAAATSGASIARSIWGRVGSSRR